MKIVVCVKTVVDVNFSLVLDQETLAPLSEDVFYRANPADLCAAEVAITLQERFGGEVSFLAFGPAEVEKALRDCLAMGGDRAVRVWDGNCATSRQAKAYVLAKATEQLVPDLVLCGGRSLDEGSGETPPAMAEFLGLPQVTSVTELEFTTDGRTLMVKRKLERGSREEVECPLPALLAFEPGVRQPRYAALSRMLQAHEAQVEVVGAENLGIDPPELKARASLTTLVRRSLPRPRPKKSFAMESGLSAEQRMELLMSGGLRQGAKRDFLEGRPQDVAKELAEILERKICKRAGHGVSGCCGQPKD